MCRREGATYLAMGAPNITISEWKMAVTGRVEMSDLRRFCGGLRCRREK